MKTIKGYEFKKTLRGMSNLSSKERDYLHKSFSKEMGGGLSKFEVKHRTNSLMHNKKDSLKPWELQSIRRKLIDKMK